jgi:hypothetical protein
MVNYLAVIVAAVVAYGLGALWYSPLLFGKLWMKLTKMQEPTGDAWKSYLAGFLTYLVQGVVLALIIEFTSFKGAIGGLLMGFLVWIGFIGTHSLGRVLWEKRSVKLFWLDNGYNLLASLLMGLIIGVW